MEGASSTKQQFTPEKRAIQLKSEGTPSPKTKKLAPSSPVQLQNSPICEVSKLNAFKDLLKGPSVHVAISEVEPDTLYAVGSKGSLVARYHLRKQLLVCVSKTELTGADWITEDCWGKIWVFSFGTDRKIFKLNRELFLEEFYEIPSTADLSIQPWTTPCVMNSKKCWIYFPTGLNANAVLNIHSENGIGKSKSAEVKVLQHVVHRKSISNMVLTCDDRHLVVDQGTRSVKIVDLLGEFASFDHHIDNTREKLCLVTASPTNSGLLLFSGPDRRAPSMSLFRIIPGTQLELLQTVEVPVQGFIRVILKNYDNREPLADRRNLGFQPDSFSVFTSAGEISIWSVDTRQQKPLSVLSYGVQKSDLKPECQLKQAICSEGYMVSIHHKDGDRLGDVVAAGKLNQNQTV